MKKISIIIIILLLFTFIGCTNNNNKNNVDEKKEIVDCANDKVTVPANCKKIVSIWPSGTQLFISLGLGDLLIGASEETMEQPWAKEIYPKITNAHPCSQKESAESLLTLDADVVLCSTPDYTRELRSKGVPAISFCYYSLEEMQHALEMLASILPSEYSERVNMYLNYLKSNIELVDGKLKDKVVDKKTVYYINGNNNKGLYKTAGGNTMNEEWAKNAYTIFATGDLLSSSETVVNQEAILDKNPDIIVIGGRYQHVLLDQLNNASEWDSINALQNDQVFTIPLGVSPFDRFGAEIALMIPWLASKAYPSLFDYDINKEVIDFYKTYANYNLTPETASYIIDGLMPDGQQEIK